MCGLIAFTGDTPAIPLLLDGLKRLTYRGYDSAGIAIIEGDVLRLFKEVGSVDVVQEKCDISHLVGTCGIGHVRWATHGGVSQENAHPFVDCTGRIALAHNGIIDNYIELRGELEARGHKFTSRTDSEVLVHLIEQYFKDNLVEAIKQALARVKGTYAIAVLSISAPQTIVGARRGSPLVMVKGLKGAWLASDVVSIPDSNLFVEPLEDGEIRIITPSSIGGQSMTHVWDYPTKQGQEHYMLKEILETPLAIKGSIVADKDFLHKMALEVLRAKQVIFTACGTSRHAALIGRYLFSKLGGKFSDVIMASEFQYFSGAVDKGTLVIAISQSGETADVLEGIGRAKDAGAKILSLVNVPYSSLERESDWVFNLNCGPEIGVAATKTFCAQVSVLTQLAYALKGEDADGKLRDVADALTVLLAGDYKEQCLSLAQATEDAKDFYLIGRGINFAMASEGALKIKEISYIHAEGMPAGELKHGTLALIDRDVPVLAICPRDETYDDTLANIHEAKARGGVIIGVSDKNHEIFDAWLDIPKVEDALFPLVVSVPLQLFAYYAAVVRGLNPDFPRHLAKSITCK